LDLQKCNNYNADLDQISVWEDDHTALRCRKHDWTDKGNVGPERNEASP
jgi:hypothetical protein